MSDSVQITVQHLTQPQIQVAHESQPQITIQPRAQPGIIVEHKDRRVIVQKASTPPSTLKITVQVEERPVTVQATVRSVFVGQPVTAGETNTAANVGAGPGLIFRDKVGPIINLRTLIGAGGAVVSVVGDTVLIDASGAGGDLQFSYDSGTDGVIVLDSVRAGVIIRDAATPIGSPLLAVQTNASGNLLSVTDSIVNISIPVDMGSNRIVSLADPIVGTDAVNLQTLQSLVNGLQWKNPAKAVETVANVTLSGLQAIDGVSFTAGERVILTAQSSAVENGAWEQQVGSWTRPSDFATGAGAANAAFWVSQGTVFLDTRWVCTTDPPNDIIDTDALAFSQFGSATLSTLQSVYNASSVPEIVVDVTRGAVTIRDALTPIGANLFEIETFAGANLFSVGASDVTSAIPLDMSSNVVRNVTNPTSDQDAATRDYHDRNYLARSRRSYIESEFIDFGNFAEGVVAIVAGAGAANGAADGVDKVDHPGIWCLETGTTSVGRGFIISSATRGYNVGGAGLTRVGSIVKTGVFLSTALEEFVDRVGFFSITLPNTILEGIGFEYQFDQNGGRWQGITADGIGESSVDLGITIVPETWYDLEFEVNAAGNSVEFFIDGVSRGTLATNIPSGTGFNLFFNFMIMKLAGTGNRSFYIDHYYIYQEVTR